MKPVEYHILASGKKGKWKKEGRGKGQTNGPAKGRIKSAKG
jgi:hypothetical protein